MTKMGTWNIRGLNSSHKQIEVDKLIKDNKLDLICLVETKIRRNNLENVKSMCFYQWEYVHNCPMEGGVARVIVGWNPKILSIEVVGTQRQALFCNVNIIGTNYSFYATFIYGDNMTENRRSLWDFLMENKGVVNDRPWILMGDFNVVRNQDEKKGINGIDIAATDEFNNCLRDLNADDMANSGLWFTWNKNQLGCNNVQSRIDRVLHNDIWTDVFPNSQAITLPCGISDHSPIITLLDYSSNWKPKPFKFFNFWMNHQEFMPILIEAWDVEMDGNPMMRLFRKLNRVKVSLKNFNKKFFNRISIQVTDIKSKLDNLQRALDIDGSNEEIQMEEKEMREKYTYMRNDEESFLRQKARTKWLQLGDQNNAFFHKKVNQNLARRKIVSIENDMGVRVEGREKVARESVRYFQNLFGNRVQCVDADDVLGEVIKTKLNSHQAELLEADVSHDEIKAAMFAIGSDKAPGPDGFNSHFFKENWQLVGDDVCDAIKYFFDTGMFFDQWNCTALALIPKISTPVSMKDFRPISCCNTIYKCISKVITRRLKKLMPILISNNQAAFVEGRSIADNILLLQELMRNYHRDSLPPRCVIKIDMLKAYDLVSWDFLINLLVQIGFPSKVIGWITMCVTTTRFSINLNGELNGFFPGRRGLRQGDPLSPYLFLLVMEAFTGIISKATESALFKHHPKCKEMSLTHLSFADDLVVFTGGDKESCRIVKDAIAEFSSYSGLMVNLDKSSLFTAGINMDGIQEISSILGIQHGHPPFKYLGVPLITTRLKKEDCQILVDRITMRVRCWTNKFLSFAGRLLLVKTVIFSIQVYWACTFILPKSIIKKIEQVMKNYLWKGDETNSKGAKVAWEDICVSLEEGGLNIKSLETWNIAAMAKHLWNLCSKKDSLWIKWCNIYKIKGRSIWALSIPNDASWSWRKILKIREKFRRQIKTIIGNGTQTFMWYDLWHPNGPLFPLYGNNIVYDSASSLKAKVSDFIHQMEWRWPSTVTWELNEVKNASLPAILEGNDYVVWLPSKKGTFTIASAWELLKTHKPTVTWSKFVWSKVCIPKCSFIAWLVFRKAINTKDKLFEWGISEDDLCGICGSKRETYNHLFSQCSLSKSIWEEVMLRNQRYRKFQSWNRELSLATVNHSTISLCDKIRSLSFITTIYCIWMERNSRCFKHVFNSLDTIVKGIENMVKAKVLTWKKDRRNYTNWMACMYWNIPENRLLS